MKKRSRACEECHRLKIKCDVSTSHRGVCERCSRNELECVPTAPRLQRDRINELEAQVQELKNALRDQSNSSNSTTPSRSPSSLLEDQSHTALSFLDARITRSKQQALFRLIARQAGIAWPVIHLPKTLDYIRTKSPILLLCVLVHTVTQEMQGTETDVHDDLVRETTYMLGAEVIGKGQRSLELVQALLVTSFWNKPTRGAQQGTCFQLIQLAADMAIDLGIAGYSLQPSAAAYFSRHEDPTSLEARRTWLACFVALSTLSISARRSIMVPWNGYHQECLLHLESKGDSSDVLLCQIVRINQLIQEISNRLSLCQLTTFVDGNDFGTHAVMGELKDEIDAWVAQIPPSLALSQTLKFWRHVATIYIYELVLHTPTNKASFAAPFIPGRIAVNDFPKPANIIPPLRTALAAIIQNCHAAIDIATEMGPNLALNLPTICFAPTVLYSLFVLLTVMVAATDPANTYGQCLTEDSFRIEQCNVKLRNLTAQLKSLDPTLSSFATRMLDATGWLEEWYNNYIIIVRQYKMNLAS